MRIVGRDVQIFLGIRVERLVLGLYGVVGLCQDSCFEGPPVGERVVYGPKLVGDLVWVGDVRCCF